MEKTMTEMWAEDLTMAHIIKINTKAKNLPDVWHRAIQLVKKNMEDRR